MDTSMKTSKAIFLILSVAIFVCCHNRYLEEYYLEPKAAFSTNLKDGKAVTLESVIFQNQGSGQYFSVYTGDAGHKYGEQGNSGFAIGSSGSFSYSYREPGLYSVVWIASSVDAKGAVDSSIDSVKLIVEDLSGGLDELSIYKIYRLDEYDESRNTYYHAKAEQVDDSTLVCPIIYEAWREGKINSIKSEKLQLKYQLTSPTAKLMWYQQKTESWIQIKSETDNIFSVVNDGKITIQRIKVVTGSGYEKHYRIAAVMIPKLTSYRINGVEGEITHVKTSYNEYEIRLKLPVGTNLGNLCPEFIVMDNDVNLYDGDNAKVSIDGIVEQSGVNTVDFSSGEVMYDVYYQMSGYDDAKLYTESKVRVIIDLQ